MIIVKEIEIDMGHTVTNHNSVCKHLHGHRYRIAAAVDGELATEGASEGMVMDFGVLKTIMMSIIHNPYDHAFVIWKGDPRTPLLRQAHELWHNDINKFHELDFIPTAENLAKHWFKLLSQALAEHKIKLQQLEVHETPTSCAVEAVSNAY